VQPGQDGSFVYIAKDGKAQLHNVQVDRQVDELVVISKGLAGGEPVISDVPPTLAAGSAITVRNAEGKAEKGEAKGKSKGKGKEKESPGKDGSGKESSKEVAGREAKP
jgi:hypothetical protein